MIDELPKRKPNRLKDFDYSTDGAYFVTICTKDRRCILSKIVGDAVPYKCGYTIVCVNTQKIDE